MNTPAMPVTTPRRLVRDTLLLLVLGTLLGLGVNALRPDGLPLGDDWQVARLVRQIDNAVRPVTLDEAMKLRDAGALFIDAREGWEFEEGRIPGAASLPLEAVRDGKDAGNAKARIPVIVYCGSKDCGKAEILAQELAKRGVDVRYMPEGIQGWLMHGGQVEMP